MNTQKPTPRTDAHVRENVGNGTRYSDIAKFARELECEVESKHGCWMLELRRVSDLERENEAMRAAIQEAVTALRAWPKAGHGMSTDFTLQSQAFRSGQSALAALKPFLPETPCQPGE